MQFSEKRNTIRWIIIMISFFIVAIILWNTYTFFQIFKTEERYKMELLAKSLETINAANLETDDIDLQLEIISQNKTIPVIVLNENNNIVNTTNIDSVIVSDQNKINKILKKIQKENDPILMEVDTNTFQYLYYGNSSLLNQLKYYPIALLLIIVLFVALVYNFYKSSKASAQNKLWAGMAKETAHQIGTPLSSLIGWLEIMKADNVDKTTISEIEKDITRLQTITDRFSKIGSEPILEKVDLIKETSQSFEYLKSRFSQQVIFKITKPEYPVYFSLNPVLHSWTIENLVKNAIDAMKGKGTLILDIMEDTKFIKIKVSDTGKGIPKNQFKRIFEPGFTTKKRGWGLGLSLTRRIVEEYHNGKIKVLHSEIDKGTCIQISFKKIE